jgi:hypothetical protein
MKFFLFLILAAGIVSSSPVSVFVSDPDVSSSYVSAFDPDPVVAEAVYKYLSDGNADAVRQIYSRQVMRFD